MSLAFAWPVKVVSRLHHYNLYNGNHYKSESWQMGENQVFFVLQLEIAKSVAVDWSPATALFMNEPSLDFLILYFCLFVAVKYTKSVGFKLRFLD